MVKRKRGDAAGGEPKPLRVLQARHSAPLTTSVPDRELYTGEHQILNNLLEDAFNNDTRPVRQGHTLHHVLENWRTYTNNASDAEELEEVWDDAVRTPLIYQYETPPQSPPEYPYSGAGRGFVEPHSLNRMVINF